jgi:hypothetical protein
MCTTDGCSKGTYTLSLKMTPLNHLLEAPSAYSPDNVDIATFIEVTSIIGGSDAVEEFLACGLWHLSEKDWF